MRILFLGYSLDGVRAPHHHMAALWFARNGHEVLCVQWGRESVPEWALQDGRIRYELVPKGGPLAVPRYLAAVRRALKEFRPAVLYVQGAQQTPMALWFALGHGERTTIYHTQDFVGPGQHLFYETFERLMARNSDWVISNDPGRGRALASIFRLNRMTEVIRTALPRWWPVPERDEAYRQELIEKSGLRGAEQPRLIVAGGPYSPGRMSPELLDALARMPLNYRVIFSGGDENDREGRQCAEHARRIGLEGRILQLPELTFEELLKLYAASDIGVLLYPNSGIGHFHQAPGRLTEYLRCGLAVIASNFPGFELLTLKYQLGEVADPYSPVEIASRITRIGGVPDAEMAARRARLAHVASTDLAYEAQADAVLTRLTQPAPGIAKGRAVLVDG
ncbi:glycosyltransferase [Paludibaculum fermentans]|uniref:Glycosyltransferase n=1 Tax=Paludibaculum fermentans TaxID=1473598 RepID=A0A7S7NK35_PALFE|nr:glycosyltransferase [Paludibaculum fermentans]QOY85096.1 glycosyltransferase [Paludibaculum fermentans]